MPRREYESQVSTDRYVDRDDRTYVSTRARDRRSDERVVEEEEYYRSSARSRQEQLPARERELRVRQPVAERERSAPPPLAFMRENYDRAGPVVLRKRDVEEFDFAPRRRSLTPEAPPPPERRLEKEEIIIRRDEVEPRSPPPPVVYRRPDPPRERDREEIIIRRDERETPAAPPPRREEREREREEIIIRRDEKKTIDPEPDYRYPPVLVSPPVTAAPRREERDRQREEIIIRRDEKRVDAEPDYRYPLSPPPPPPPPPRWDNDERSTRESILLTRAVSHERERSRPARPNRESDQEIIIRQEQRDGAGGNRGRGREQEIIVRNHSRSSSSESGAAAGRYAAPTAYYQAPTYPPPTIIAPPAREDPISRAIERDYQITLTPRRPASRPPSPPSPPPEREWERERSTERISIHRSGEKDGREFKEDIIIDRNDGRSRSPLPPPPARRERDTYYDTRPPPGVYDRDVEEEAAHYNEIALQRGYVGEAYQGATRDWSLVDVPPGTRRVRMDGAGGGEQEITWQRYNGVRRSKFYPDGTPYDGYVEAPARPAAAAAAGGLGASWAKPRDPRDGLWTEITKDLVVKEAIKEMGYEYEETDDYYYVFKYLSYEDMARLVGLSDDIKNARQKRIKEIGWESRVLPEAAAEPAAAPSSSRLLIESSRESRESRHPPWTADDERYIEREVVYRSGRPPPPPAAWRR